MKSFSKQILLFILVASSITILYTSLVFFNLPNIKYNGFFGDNIQARKLIIAGASNTEYNYNYLKIQEEFKDFNVLGSSVNAPSGLMVNLYKIKQLDLDSSDVVILCLPHSLYSKEKFLPISSKQKVISKEVVKSSFKFSPMMTVITFLRVNILNIRHALYTRDILGVRKYTDPHIYNAIHEQPLYSDTLYSECYHNTEDKFFINDATAEFDEEYLGLLETRIPEFLGAKVYYRFPVLPNGEFLLNNTKVSWLESNFNFINNIGSSIVELNLFYNQWYHLNECGAEANTEAIINELSFLK